jgi:hypothetical protein
LKRPETRSISIEAPCDAVFGFVEDPRNLPRWAPAFASAIRPDGDRWIVTAPAGGELTIVVVANAAAGTVDILAATDRRTGAFARILPNEAGSQMVFTLLFAPDTNDAEVAAQMAVVDDELAAVRRFVEGS